MATQTTERAFDELTRGLASGTLSRGKALRLMGAALVGGALASVPGTALADDDCRGFGRRCRRDSQCCSRNCVRRGDDKVCGCPEGKTRCKDRCVDLQTNERHCGSCSNSCAEGSECVSGECTPACGSNGSDCSGDPDCCSGNCVNSTCSACPGGPIANNYGTCMSNDQCCSGNCSNGFCCASGRVGLSNGTCVIVSSGSGTDCTCPAGCSCEAERDPAGSRQLCASNETAQRCSGHISCGEGSFCGGSATDPRCQLVTC
jgi:hypothetical protein